MNFRDQKKITQIVYVVADRQRELMYQLVSKTREAKEYKREFGLQKQQNKETDAAVISYLTGDGLPIQHKLRQSVNQINKSDLSIDRKRKPVGEVHSASPRQCFKERLVLVDNRHTPTVFPFCSHTDINNGKLFQWLRFQHHTSRDAQDSSFPNLAGAGPGQIHEHSNLAGNDAGASFWELWTANAVWLHNIRSD